MSLVWIHVAERTFEIFREGETWTKEGRKKLQRRNNKIALLCYAKPLRRLYFMNRDIIIISLSLISSGEGGRGRGRPTTYMYPHLQGSLQPRFNLICPSVSRALVRKAANREIQLLSSHTTPHPTSSSVSTIFRHKLVSCWKKYVALSFTIFLLLPWLLLLAHDDPSAPTHDCRFITDFLLVLFELCLFLITTARRVGWKKCFECCFLPAPTGR